MVVPSFLPAAAWIFYERGLQDHPQDATLLAVLLHPEMFFVPGSVQHQFINLLNHPAHAQA